MKAQTTSALWRQAMNSALRIEAPNAWIMNKKLCPGHQFYTTQHAEQQMTARGVTLEVIRDARACATGINTAVFYDFSSLEERSLQGTIVCHTATHSLVVKLPDIPNDGFYELREHELLCSSEENRQQALRRIDEALSTTVVLSENEKEAALEVRLSFSRFKDFRHARFFGAVLQKHWGANKCEICHKLVVFMDNGRTSLEQGDLVLLLTASMNELVTAYFVDFNHPKCHPVLKVKNPATTSCRDKIFKKGRYIPL
jgi:hypothetical protein